MGRDVAGGKKSWLDTEGQVWLRQEGMWGEVKVVVDGDHVFRLKRGSQGRRKEGA